MPLVRRNKGHYSGVIADHANFQRFTTTGSTLTWTKPGNVSIVWIECVGGGGGGGGDTGSGGGGTGGTISQDSSGGNGGSGVVIIRYKYQ